ncbi:MAG: leucine-rich repeat protein [Treponema sp.]|nr:leucine-rich repeat protein [Treponema sp.]
MSYKSLEIVALPRTVTYIDAYAFKNCTSLRTVSVLRNVTEIGGETFTGCNNLVVQFDGTKEQWEAIKRGVIHSGGSTIRTGNGNYEVHCTDGDFSKQKWWYN